MPTFPNARYVISKRDFEYYQKLDADPNKAEPVEFEGTAKGFVPRFDP
ncbi:MAG: hypothetical protein ACJ8DY_21230 [Xanthobacteraceae bacterium]